MCEAIKGGLVLPNLPQIVPELTTPTYTFKGDKMIVEDKEQVKLRLGRSPNFADALATTFAQPVHARRTIYGLSQPRAAQTDYNPYASV
jgi:hypothetical protein